MFQIYNTDHVTWGDWSSVDPYTDGLPNAAAFKASYVDVQIDVGKNAEGNPTVPVVEFVEVS